MMDPEDYRLLNEAVMALNKAIETVYRRSQYGKTAVEIRPGVNYSVGEYAEVFIEVTTGVVKVRGEAPAPEVPEDDCPF